MARVLVVEDTPANLDLMEFLIRQAGHHALLAHNASEALELLAQHSVDLAFVDIFMPGMDGFELMAKIRESTEWAGQCRYIAVTALASDKDRERILDAGFDAYMSKPVDAEKVLGILQTLPLEGRT